MKYFTNVPVANGYNRFAVIEIFIASNRNIRPDIKWVLSIVYLILCIAFSSTNRAYLLCLTLFPKRMYKKDGLVGQTEKYPGLNAKNAVVDEG